MNSALLAFVATSGGVLLAGILVGGVVLLRGGFSGLLPSRRADSELGRAREDIQEQIDRGSGGLR